MSDTERKTEENESSSDEEPPKGELDQPIVILYNKRAKKEIKRFEASEKKEKSKPEKKDSTVNIPNGKGQSLETMSEVVKNFASESDKDLKVIFEVLFGHKKVKLHDVRKHLRKWNGWDVDPDSQEHHELQEGIGSMTTENIKWAMDTLDISRRGLPKKDHLVDKFCDWCLKPEPFGKDSQNKSSNKTPTKKSPTKVASTSKDEKPKKERKRKPEKDPNKPKKPQTAFLLFLNKNRVSFNEEAGTKNPGEIGKLASEKWKALSDAEKEPFSKEAETAKAAYDIEIKQYNENKSESSPPKKPKKEKVESAKKKTEKSKTEKKSEKQSSSSPKATKVEKKPKAEKSKSEKSDSKNDSKNDSKSSTKKATTDSDKPMLALEKGKLVSKGSSKKSSSKSSENGTSSKKVEKSSKSEKKSVEKSKSQKSKSTEKSTMGSPKKPKNTIIIPNEKQIENFLVKLIKQSNLEQLTMKQVLAKVAEKYPDMNVSSKKSFIKTKVKELIQ